MKVFTPNPWKSNGNIEFIPMTVEEYDELLFETTGVKADNCLTADGVPAKLISDHYVAWGQVFHRYIRDVDYWGITNFDVVYGRLDRFIPDEILGQFDIWSDDGSPAINGIFTLFSNDDRINNLFRLVPDWETSFTVHEPAAFDEIQMTNLVRKLSESGEIEFGHPAHFGYHSYDRLVQHQPKPNLYIAEDGALIERFEDHVHAPSLVDHYGREILAFHFSKTKTWPIQ